MLVVRHIQILSSASYRGRLKLNKFSDKIIGRSCDDEKKDRLQRVEKEAQNGWWKKTPALEFQVFIEQDDGKKDFNEHWSFIDSVAEWLTIKVRLNTAHRAKLALGATPWREANEDGATLSAKFDVSVGERTSDLMKLASSLLFNQISPADDSKAEDINWARQIQGPAAKQTENAVTEQIVSVSGNKKMETNTHNKVLCLLLVDHQIPRFRFRFRVDNETTFISDIIQQ